MAGINLSQSIQEKQAIARGSFLDKGFFINVAIFLVVAGIYGASQWYLGTLEDKLVMLQADSVQKAAGLKNADANSATDMRIRLSAIATNLQSEPDPNGAFQELEQTTVPMIRVTDYAQDQGDSTIIIQGVTTSLKYLAQQMLSYKKITGVISVHVADVKYNDVGQIEFKLHLSVTPKSETTTASPLL